MEENYQKTQAHTNSRVYKDAFERAFQWPGIGYTLLIWGACYGVHVAVRRYIRKV